VLVGEDRHFAGGVDWLREAGVEVTVVDSPECVELMDRFIAEHPEIWNEDIGEE
jgi:cytosine/creatinine deaminase